MNSVKRAKAKARLRASMHASRASCAAIAGIIEAVDRRACGEGVAPPVGEPDTDSFGMLLIHMAPGELLSIYRFAKRGM